MILVHFKAHPEMMNQSELMHLILTLGFHLSEGCMWCTVI